MFDRPLSLLALCTVLAALPARAAPDELEPDLEGELDLQALAEEGRLTEEALAALLDLSGARVDLETAPRAELYGLPGLTYARVDALVRAREAGGAPEAVLTPEELQRLAPFLSRRGRDGVSGWLRAATAYAPADTLVPPVVLQARGEGFEGFRGGLMASLTRRRLGTVRLDAGREALLADAPATALSLPKLYVQWTGERASVLVGTYRLGFGQRLTLDTTSRPTPDGFTPDDGFVVKGGAERLCLLANGCTEEGDVTPDFRWTEGFRGVVGSVRGPVGEGTALSLTGFGSYQSRSLSQYELLDAAACRTLGGKKCRAPQVLLAQGEEARFVSRTLPGVFHELAGGGHAALAFSPRAQLGLTGWVARPASAVAGLELDFQASSRYPSGGPFGAVGVDAAWGAGPVDLFAEVARSFDSAQGGGGGLGAVQRSVLGDEQQELELTLRYYGRGFANPYAGASSGPDEDEGLRARNELGARVRYVYRVPEAWRLRGDVDVWALPSDGVVPGSAGTAHLRASARVDWLALSFLQPSLWVEHRDKDLAQGGRGQCFAGSDGTLPSGAPKPCAGAQSRVGARLRLAFEDVLAVAAQYQHTLVDSRRLPEAFQHDGRAALDVLVRPVSSLRVRGRATWLDADLFEPTRGEQALRTTVDVSWVVLDAVTTRARYEVALDLSEAPGTRTPPDSPRHQLRLELETRF